MSWISSQETYIYYSRQIIDLANHKRTYESKRKKVSINIAGWQPNLPIFALVSKVDKD